MPSKPLILSAGNVKEHPTIIVPDGSGALMLQNNQNRIKHFNHFLGNASMAQDGIATIQTAGTGNTVNPSFVQFVTPSNPRPGVIRLNSGSCDIAASRCSYHTGNNAGSYPLWMLLTGRFLFETSIAVGQQSNNVTNRFHVQVGFGNGISGLATCGASFLYNETAVTTSSPNWQVQTGNGTTQTRQTTSVPVVFNQFYKLKVDLSPTQALFYIDDVLVATITTNLPDSAYTNVKSFGFGNVITKQSITATDTINAYIDMDYVDIELTLP